MYNFKLKRGEIIKSYVTIQKKNKNKTKTKKKIKMTKNNKNKDFVKTIFHPKIMCYYLKKSKNKK